MSRTVLLGPPGTGKTTALMAIVNDLLAEGFRSHEIAFVSYSRAAVAEARDRVVKRTGIDGERWPGFRTLHSTWSRLQGMNKEHFLTTADIKRLAGTGTGFDLGDRDESSEDAYIDADERDGADAPLRSALDWCRATMQHESAGVQRLRNPRKDAHRYREFCDAYRSLRAKLGKLDHTDILEQALADRKTIPCRVLIVDEAQDLSPLQQATLARTIAAVERAWVAGDDDQAIYEFQGASPKWLISLTRDPSWTTRILDHSWRCPEDVRAPAQMIAERLTERAAKAYSARQGAGSYRTAVPFTDALAPLVAGDRSAFALARTKRGCSRLGHALREAGAPYIAERGGRSPLDPRGLRGLFDVLHAIYTGEPVSAFELAKVVGSAGCPGERGKKRNGIVGHGGKARIKPWAERHGDTPMTIDRETADELGLDRAFCLDPWDLLASVEAWPKAAGDAKDDLAWLRRLWTARGGAWPQHACIVTTWHGSKGREADLVIIDPALPYPAAVALSQGGETADTEHRCAYVALTRTRRDAVILDQDPEAHDNYRFPPGRHSPSSVAETKPAAAWGIYRSGTDIDGLVSRWSHLPTPAMHAIVWAWHGWRDLFDTAPIDRRDVPELRKALPTLPRVVAERLAEVML